MFRCAFLNVFLVLLLVDCRVSLAQESTSYPLINLNGHFPMEVPASRELQKENAATIRTRIRLATGLLPMPELADPAPVIYGRREMNGYSIEKVYFESLPGYFVTGNLYRPSASEGKQVPAVLCPHGHWREGRFYDAGEALARRHLASGAERFESAARNHIQARCVQIARMGCVAFQWDMAGYADSDQISLDRIHGFKKQDASIENGFDGWLLYSPQAESHLQSSMALQTINALQAVRVINNLPDVDPTRIAMTGASGGGTQTFISAAIDESIAAAFPAVMVSTGMQGGCTCENACYLRVGGGNIDIAACIAPRPLGLTAADDWTRTMREDGYPQLREVYGLFGAKKQIQFTPLIHFKHNYNHVSRVAFYSFLNRVFDLGVQEPVLESDFQRLEPDELTVWDEEHQKPEGGLEFERRLLQKWHEDTKNAVKATVSAASRDNGSSFKRLVNAALTAMVGQPSGKVAITEFELLSKIQLDECLRMTGILSEPERGRRIEMVFSYPNNWNGDVQLVAHSEGNDAVMKLMNDPESQFSKSLVEGACIASLDLLFSGVQKQRLVREDRLAACYTYGYNSPLIVRRTKDLLAAIRFIRDNNRNAKSIKLVGIAGAGPIALLAGAVAEDSLDECEIELDDFKFEKVSSIKDPNFLPGGARFLDVDGMLAMHAPRPVKVQARNEPFDAAKKIYAAHGASEALTVLP